MAIGKSRGSKRSSGGSYASTLTTLVLVSVCVVGVWMLTSNSVTSPQKTVARIDASTDESSSDTKRRSNLPRKIPITTITTSEDIPGDLTTDDIKPEEVSTANIDPDPVQETDENPAGDGSKETEPEPEPKSTDNAVEENADLDDSDAGKQEAVKEEQDLATSTAVVEENPHGLVGKVSLEEEQKQIDKEIQMSEESTLTHNQHTEELVTDKKSTGNEEHEQVTSTGNEEDEQKKGTGNEEDEQKKSIRDEEDEKTKSIEKKEDELEKSSGNEDGEKKVTGTKEDEETRKNDDREESDTGTQEDKQTEMNGGDETGDTGNSDQNQLISDEEQEKRMENQQQQEEEQSQQGETSDEQAQHDEDTPIESHSIATETKAQVESQHEAQEVSTQMDQAKIETTTTTTKEESSSNIPKETKDGWSTQADESHNQKDRGQGSSSGGGGGEGTVAAKEDEYGYKWELCNVTAGADYIPCLDNEAAIKKLHGRNHYEHRERHCPEESPMCLVPLPEGYKTPIQWPQSRDKIWFHNVPHKALADVKGHQNWVKMTGEFLTFPGGGTQFIHGALHYIDFVQQAVPAIAWGKHTRVVLDVGCGVASFGGYLFDRDVLAFSFAPKDEHEAQIQLALERGIPAISAVMGTQRLPFPSKVFDLVHCARCRVPWHIEGGKLLLELNRVLRPGGYFVWSATPVYQTLEEDVMIWKEMSALTLAMCWELVTIKKDKLNSVGIAVYHKPNSNECYNKRKKQQPPMCKPDDDPNAAWYVPLQACIHKVAVGEKERGSQWPEEWPARVQTPPYWLNTSQVGIYGKPAPEDFKADYEHWKWVVSKSYMSNLGISWANVRNVMDMRAVYGGFAAALKDLKLWVLNVVNIDSPDTLPIIYERGLFGIYHDWCESFSAYPRTYDLLHADHLFSKLKKRCKIASVMVEVDRIVRPGGKLIARDESSTIGEIEKLLKSLHWEVHSTLSNDQEGILSAQKSTWRPDTYEAAPS